MFGDEQYEDGKYPKELELSPRVQRMSKYPRYSPDDGTLPRCLCCKTFAYACCSSETEGAGPARCCFALIFCGLKLTIAHAGVHTNGTLKRGVLDKVHAYAAPSKFKSFRVRDFDIPSRDKGRSIPCRTVCNLDATSDRQRPVMLYLHGGGFCQGNCLEASTTKMMTLLVKELDIVCLAVNYRLAPEHPFPAGLQDVYDCMKWLANESDTADSPFANIPLDLDCVLLFGESAGANLVLVASTLWRDKLNAELEPSDDLANLTIKAQISDYPTLCLPYATPSSYTHGRNLVIPFYAMRWYRNSYLPEEKRAELFKDRRVCPLLAGMDNLPKTLHMYVGYDPLVDENHKLAEVLAESNTDADSKFYPQHVHGVWGILQGTDPDKSQFAYAVQFLKPVVASSTG